MNRYIKEGKLIKNFSGRETTLQQLVHECINHESHYMVNLGKECYQSEQTLQL